MTVSNHWPQTRAMPEGHAKGRRRGCAGSGRGVYASKRHEPSVEWSLLATENIVFGRKPMQSLVRPSFVPNAFKLRSLQ